jgi:transposase-like protein
MSDFKGRRFPTNIILVCVRWYCKYGISYRDLKEMTSERGVIVDHTTLFRWVQHYAPLMEKRVRWYQRYTDAPWRMDETYVKVAGQWAYLYRALDKNGDLIDFMLSPPDGEISASLPRQGAEAPSGMPARDDQHRPERGLWQGNPSAQAGWRVG